MNKKSKCLLIDERSKESIVYYSTLNVRILTFVTAMDEPGGQYAKPNVRHRKINTI